MPEDMSAWGFVVLGDVYDRLKLLARASTLHVLTHNCYLSRARFGFLQTHSGSFLSARVENRLTKEEQETCRLKACILPLNSSWVMPAVSSSTEIFIQSHLTRKILVQYLCIFLSTSLFLSVSVSVSVSLSLSLSLSLLLSLSLSPSLSLSLFMCDYIDPHHCDHGGDDDDHGCDGDGAYRQKVGDGDDDNNDADDECSSIGNGHSSLLPR